MTNETDVKYMTRSAKTIRGMEARTRAKLEQEGWEFVSQTQGRVSSELTFRKPAPKTPWRLYGILGGVLVLLFVVVLVMNLLNGGDDAADNTLPTPTPTSAVSSTPTAAPSDEVTPSETPEPPAPPVTDTTVDALLDQLNSADMGGIKLGDRFRLTGELFMSEFWGTGAAGEYTVLLKAQGGAQDLLVFVDESDTSGWTDGTQVEMIVESVEETINGETTDGWLRVVSATVAP